MHSYRRFSSHECGSQVSLFFTPNANSLLQGVKYLLGLVRPRVSLKMLLLGHSVQRREVKTLKRSRSLKRGTQIIDEARKGYCVNMRSRRVRSKQEEVEGDKDTLRGSSEL